MDKKIVSNFSIEIPTSWDFEAYTRKVDFLSEEGIDVFGAKLTRKDSTSYMQIESVERAIYPFEKSSDTNGKPYVLMDIGRVRKCTFGDFEGVFDFWVEDGDAGEEIHKNYIVVGGTSSLEIKCRCLRSRSKVDLKEAEEILSSLKKVSA